jgi:hypothetical protein
MAYDDDDDDDDDDDQVHYTIHSLFLVKGHV